MKKNMVCIECPKSCAMSVDIEGDKAVNVRDARCPKGILYASSEIENPVRILTATVITDGLTIKLLPVRTDRPIPKKDLSRAMEEVSKMRAAKPVRAGDTIADGFLGSGIKLIATRRADRQ